MKQQYRLVCSDIDGTILNASGVMTRRTQRAILALHQRGIPVVLISARPPAGILCFYQALGIRAPICAYSGGYLEWDGQILANRTIQLPDVRMVCDAARESGVHLSLYQGEHWYTESMDPAAQWEADAIGFLPQLRETDALLQEWEEQGIGPNKLLCIGEPDTISALQDRLCAAFGGRLSICLSKPTYLEIMPAGVNKAGAVETLCRHFSIPREAVVAFGDQFNDLEMLQEAGLGIAVANAPEAVRSAAGQVTQANDQDGVAAALERLFSLEQLGGEG